MKHLYLAVPVLMLLFIATPGNAQDSLNVTQLGYLSSPGSATDIVVQGNTAYIADWEAGILIVDVSDPTDPQELATVSTVGEADDVDVLGDLMAIADRSVGLVLWDVSDPANPVEMGSTSIRGFANALDSDSGLVYFADGNFGLGIYDVSDPDNPAEIGFSGSNYSALDICFEGGRAYTSDGTPGIHIFNISDPENPSEMASFDPEGFGGVFSLGVEDYILAFTDNQSTLYLSNARDPNRFSVFATVPMPSAQSIGCEVQDEYVYVANQGGGLQIVSFGDRDDIHIAGHYSSINMSAKGIALANGLVYVAGDDGLHIFDFEDPDAAPDLIYDFHYIEDAGQANPNGRPDPGETVAVTVGLRNDSSNQSILSLSGVLSCDNETITISDPNAVWPDIDPGFTEINEDDLLMMTIPEGFPSGVVTFTLTLTFSGEEPVILTFDQQIGAPDVAVVNDFDEGTDVGDAWQAIVSAASIQAQIFTSAQALDDGLADYRTVIWGTSDDSLEVLSEAEQALISAVVNRGTNLLLTSSNAGEDVGSTTWFEEIFGVTHGDDTVESPYILGVSGGPFDGSALTLGGAGGAGNSSSPSSMTALDNTVRLYRYSANGSNAGVAYDGGGFATAYLGFALEAVTGADATLTAADVLVDILDYLNSVNSVGEGEASVTLPSAITLDAWPNPFNASLQVGYSLPAPGELRVEVFDLLGRHVALLKQGHVSAGHGLVNWDATSAASGTYLVRLSTPQGETVRRVQLVK